MKKITEEMAQPVFAAYIRTFMQLEEIDPNELDAEETESFVHMANYFFLAGLVYAAGVGDVVVVPATTQTIH